jgi:rhodanese-related sulfurtransferase
MPVLSLKRLLPFLAFGLSLLVAACGSAMAPAATNSGPPAASAPLGTPVTTAHGQYTDITPATLQTMLAHKDFFLVDVHVPHEGRLPDLDARIPYDQIAQHLDQLPTDKSAKIVLTCRSGHMSTIASHTLADLGYTHVFNLAGGFNAWQAAGYPLSPEEPDPAAP